jgi:SSS family transporter
MTLAAGFTNVDWAVVALYFVLLAGTGWVFSLRKVRSDREYFLGERNAPVWAVAVSILATALSAATFIGAPMESYTGDLTYISTSIGPIVAAFVIAAFFVPVYYRFNVTTVYQLLERRFGPAARGAASWTFMIGRVFASGARIYIAAIPLTMILYGDLHADRGAMLVAIALLMAAGTGYTLVGGMRSIIWTDVIQTVVFVGAAAVSVWVLWGIIDRPAAEVIAALREPAPGAPSKLTALRAGVDPGAPGLGFDLSQSYTLLTALTGFMLLNLAALGTDQDLAQRMLSCRSAAKGAQSVILSQLITVPVVLLFLLIGLLLFVVNKRPDLVAPPAYEVAAGTKVFPQFILQRMPTGLKGLMMAGLFAAALTTILSALNAMSAAFVTDFYRKVRPARDDGHYLRVSRLAVVGWGVVVGGFAMLCVAWHEGSGETLIQFALKVMIFAYAGLVGVFFCAIFTRRGAAWSVIAALVVGAAAVLLLEPLLWSRWAAHVPIGGETASGAARTLADVTIAFPWRLTIAAACAFAVCVSGRSARPAESSHP